MLRILFFLFLFYWTSVFSQDQTLDKLMFNSSKIDLKDIELFNTGKAMVPNNTKVPTSYGDKIISWDQTKFTDINGTTVINGYIYDKRISTEHIFRNATMTIHGKTGNITIIFSDHDGTFTLRPATKYSKSFYIEEPKNSNENDSILPKCGLESNDLSYINIENYNIKKSKKNQKNLSGKDPGICYNTQTDIGCSEKDANGKYVIDIFIGYSLDAERYLTDINDDIDSHAARMVSRINQSLSNSLVDNVYLRLVGTAVKDHNTGINLNPDGLAYVSTLFENEMIETGADYIAMYQERLNPKSYNTAEGWGDTLGRKSINAIESENVLRHEVGHNFGSSHCSGGSAGFPYANGYNNGIQKTIMCGNEILYYSNPEVTLSGGAIGTESFNNNARLIRERALEISNISTHRIPYDNNDFCFAEGVVAVDYPQHVGSYLGNRINSVQIGDIYNSSTDPTCNNIIGYSNYRDFTTTHAKGSSVNFVVTGNYNFSNSRTHLWIDWSGDGIFQSSELIKQSTGEQVLSGTINVPTNIEPGSKVMRIRRLSADNPYSPTPVSQGGNYEGGETEDYTFIVTDPNSNNNIPTVSNISETTEEDVSIQITLNGNDYDNDTLTYYVNQPNNGSVVLNNNVATYTPELNFFGNDSFNYMANDGISNSQYANVNVVVSGINDPPSTSNFLVSTVIFS